MTTGLQGAPDFLDLDDARASRRSLDRTDIVFQTSHASLDAEGGLSLSRTSLSLDVDGDTVRVPANHIVAWSLRAEGGLIVVTVWSERPTAVHETTVLPRFARMASSALTEVLGAEHGFLQGTA
ncbi:hypothetical protein IFU30_01355 [Plantibacter sp. CFBP 8798]|uniref:hypothetical protein n=1 Tax=Plantibacter sp. CFBP 8798 TaxID=2775268 RepID=UPI00177B5760|nr:hypothetical protein [Plantibacter sp. CFBP 8798]MBD8464899.1 hypothetical protein [Plantibacter sp. CFBP 8798]